MAAAQRRGLVESIRVPVPGMAPPNPSICPVGSCCPVRAMIENRHNFQRTGPLARLMYYRGGSWIDFPSRVVESLRPCFVQRRLVVDLVIDGSLYLFDFPRMLQTDFESGSQRSIAWMDDAGSCFFPKSFVEDLEDNSMKRKREDRKVEEEEEAEVSSSNDKLEDESKRRCLAPGGDHPEKSPWANARLLEEGEGAYLRIKNYFLSGLKDIDAGAMVTAIYQCEWTGDLGRARSEVFQKQAEIMKAARGASNTVYAWHGTSKKHVDSILAHGFTGPGSITWSGSYGVGVYFSSMGLPHLSAVKSELDENGEKHVILCRVTLGNLEKVELGSKQSHPSSVSFDTGVDDPSNPKWYVVWCSNMNTHVLPEFVVSFRPSDRMKGPPKEAGCVKRSIAELFSKIRNALPPTKVQEVENLYSVFRVSSRFNFDQNPFVSFNCFLVTWGDSDVNLLVPSVPLACILLQAGRLAKDIFAKQLRSIAGDDVLLSTIREIRGSG
ncbi:probable inactive poly [ADP-ribose] polymerase SRO2 isoform X2 [Punica granatum]|uniref:Poly [ADP-ribose] polymerase n=1 Tax=Punica granatum TaxID=22663 RepID=A0A6P8EK07_PUNGR|nr:probable inactive poly [ADP-ribose] polymerase SRO2 isoform X2 [Punica granatum]